MPPPGCPAHTGHSAGVPLYGPDFAADPASVYQRLRHSGPMAPIQLAPGVDATLVTGYTTALDVLRSPETFSKDPRRWHALADGRVAPDNPVVPMMAYRPNALFSDGEAHRRLRLAITDSLERVDPNALRGYVEHSADTLIDRFGPEGRANLLGDYASVLPLLLFTRLFGCPPAYGDRLVAGMAAIFDGIDAEKANADLTQCLMDLVALKRAQPGPDVTSWLMAHPARLNDEEMIHTLVLLMGAGTEPEQNLIANGLRLLLSDDRFAGSLSGGSMPIEDALDEVLWTDPPMANYGVHFPIRDVELAGVRLREGEPVVISFAAANTDPALATDNRMGNRAHLAWSAGPHACPAQSQARLIAAVAIEKLLDRIPDVELAVPVDRLVWRPGPFHRALTELPVRFPPLAAQAAPTVPVPDHLDETSGDNRWNPSPAPSSSTLPAATSTPRQTVSAPSGRRHWWSSLVGWLRGR
ncbi:cytochrome P450 [Wenjunlia tyrosinilytica]|uniref:cytochrome P450 n=1 Tax=Wenjunlia tyrosinilytica TaxID=1544741 RepID=UPI0027E55230|nr:cytochrome P450 [Wenjunlia tyrosinilytica]